MRIVFMGTPAFAVPTLEALLNDAAFEVVAAYTQPPRPAGRGQKLTPSPIHTLAESHGVPVFTPTSLKSAEAQAEFAALNADAAVVIAYGMLLPKEILDAPKHGCINVHPSALPRWRGAAPLQRTIMAGDSTTQIVIMKMDEGLDTGPALLRKDMTIETGTTAGELHDMIAADAAPMVLEVLKNIESITPEAQSEEGVTYAAKISKAEATIDWSRPAEELLHHIHGLSPFPGAYFTYQGESIKVLKAALAQGNGAAGSMLNDTGMVACGTGALQLVQVQRAGKKAMPMEEMLRGLTLPKGTELG